MDKLGQEPAFATSALMTGEGIFQEGISKRFYVACAAMQGILAATSIHSYGIDVDYIAIQSFKVADRFLKQEYD